MANNTSEWRRGIAGVVGLLSAVNGVSMVAGPRFWYETIPGVTETGPFNPHFVLDIGFAFIASGVGLGLFAWRSKLWAAGLIGAIFLGLHGLLHTSMILKGTTSTVTLELGLVVIPALAAVVATWPPKGAFDA